VIVVDVNVLAYLLIPGKYTKAAEVLLEEDPAWAVPRLWRSELRNVLANYLRAKQMDLAEAALIYQRAEELVGSEEYEVETAHVLRLCAESKCSAYDCEYIALAEFLDVKLITKDAKLAKAFPRRTTLLSDA
jgi:predicted nucleic acid-binding protein